MKTMITTVLLALSLSSAPQAVSASQYGELLDEHKRLLREYNELVADYNRLRSTHYKLKETSGIAADILWDQLKACRGM